MRLRFLSAVILCFSSGLAVAQDEYTPKPVTDANARAAMRCDESYKGSCTVKGNTGGQMNLFTRAAGMVRSGKMGQLVIDGPCMSGCALAADLARPRTCITPSAVFYIHKGYHIKRSAHADVGNGTPEIEGFFVPPYSADFKRLVNSKGGFPNPNLHRPDTMVKINAAEASRLFPLCKHRMPVANTWTLQGAELVK